MFEKAKEYVSYGTRQAGALGLGALALGLAAIFLKTATLNKRLFPVFTGLAALSTLAGLIYARAKWLENQQKFGEDIKKLDVYPSTGEQVESQMYKLAGIPRYSMKVSPEQAAKIEKQLAEQRAKEATEPPLSEMQKKEAKDWTKARVIARLLHFQDDLTKEQVAWIYDYPENRAKLDKELQAMGYTGYSDFELYK